MSSACAALAVALVVPTGHAFAQSCAAAAAATPQGLSPEAFAQAERPLAYPSFCSIPPAPTHVRGAAGFHTEVLGVRIAGARLVRRTAPQTWSLGDTEAFEHSARAEAAPPPPMTSPADTAAFIEAMRARANPPARPR